MTGVGALWLSALAPARTAFAAPSPALGALGKSQLIYLSPLLTDGSESQCHGEVWFVHLAQDIYVVTQHDAWRAQAIRQHLNLAKIWIGEFGGWKSADNRYRSAPYLEINGQLETDSAVQATVLDLYAKKYAAEWPSWGPRFHTGLADGKRVMLHYRPVA